MKVIYNNIIPFPGFKAINLFGIVFARKGHKLNEWDLNHEAIHTQQMKEMLFILFYIWYLVEWIIRLFMKGNAYRNISFEREAFSNDTNLKYIRIRKHYAWVKYINRTVYEY